MTLRDGLQVKVLLGIGAVLLVMLGVIVLLWQRQAAMQREFETVSREAMRRMSEESTRRRGEAMASQLAGSLANPLYYFDLDTVGEISRSALRQPGIAYVLVYDVGGGLLHDGSEALEAYGQRMEDPLADEVAAARKPAVHRGASVLDASAPILIGSQRIGGVRVGLDLLAVQRNQDAAIAAVRDRTAELGQRQLLWIALLGAVLLALATTALLLMHRFVIVPVRQMAQAAGQIEAGRFEVDTPASARHDEIGDLLRAFRRMSQSIARHDREIRHIAYTDALTGLPNRAAFRDVLEQRLQSAREGGRHVALLFADIDDFKRVNDTFGHDVGDEVLLQCANRIRNAVDRHGGDHAMLSRFGGDEFVVTLEGDGVRHIASELAEALVVSLGEPIVVQGRQLFLGSSVGVTLFPEDADDATSLMKNGDVAMYQAKLAGKHCYRFYSASMNQAMERRVFLEHDLRGAWTRGELSVAYQPIYRMSDGALVGAEALLRWMHPELGLVAPASFIDVAEQSGLIETLGPQVLRTACRDAVGWRGKDDVPLFVSVNVSPRQLRSGDLPEVVADALDSTGLAASALHIELTETAVIGDEAHVSRVLTRLRAGGVKVWLDDFGTGFSGLSHLRRVPVDGVKVDRSFVADLQSNVDDLALTTAIISMAHSLGIVVVAEGVEKEGQYALLRERGCDLAQGFWLGQPVRAEEFARLVQPA